MSVIARKLPPRPGHQYGLVEIEVPVTIALSRTVILRSFDGTVNREHYKAAVRREAAAVRNDLVDLLVHGLDELVRFLESDAVMHAFADAERAHQPAATADDHHPGTRPGPLPPREDGGPDGMLN